MARRVYETMDDFIFAGITTDACWQQILFLFFFLQKEWNVLRKDSEYF